ncbi:hypothetical protein PILCRDRAFT_88067 [Piloderma croceum F 1598]|uniref:DUF6830 domain-containing protein n=1 Tax=Piloderma croceum (strain F 1598) TaxID=765440 RepID=A0A0C3FZR3_PILCF|nr:hypothetical protein PILCRDRAFT_88067 [Piloderma croceum F 1598]
MACPNPRCNLIFPNETAVCHHLGDLTTECARFSQSYLNDMLERQTAAGHGNDGEYDPESLAPLHEQNEEPSRLDSWAPPSPSSIPLNTDLPQLDTFTNQHPVAGVHGYETPSFPSEGLRKVAHPSPSMIKPGGRNLLRVIDKDDEFASWLASAPLSQAEIDKFLHLAYVQQQPLSFKTAKDLRHRIEVLPEVPRWEHQVIAMPGYRTKDPMTLYWRDGLAVIGHLFANPVFANSIETTPYQLYDREDSVRAYGEFMSAQFAWDYHSSLPKGHTLLGVIGASDKTPLTIGTGNKEMHPVLLSLANINAGVRMKATAQAFALAAYLPIPKFLNVSAQLQATLAARVYHICLDIICANLKKAEEMGVTLSDPAGNLRKCHTPLVSWIADLPEQRLLACVLASQSPFSLAATEQFGDLHSLARRERSYTLGLIWDACIQADPALLADFVKVCQLRGLNGVHQPFWRDWGNADPSLFLTIDILHAFHKFFFNHPLKWVTNIMGGNELYRRMAALQPRIGNRHWRNGISKLKQVTGREHRDLQKILVSVIAGAVPINVLCAVRALLNSYFKPKVFYCGRQGKNGIIPHFRIPKLEGFIRTVWATRDITIGRGTAVPSLFHKARKHLSDNHTAAFTVTLKPHHHNMAIDAAAALFDIPDFRAALGDYFLLKQTYANHRGQRKSSSNVNLPFSCVHVWHNFRMQQYSAQDQRIMLPSCTIQALPPSPNMPFGRCNTVLINDTDGSAEHTSEESSSGCRIVQVRIIFTPMPSRPTNDLPPVYVYGQFFKFSTSHRESLDGVDVFKPALHIDMFLLHRHMRSNGQHMGDIVQLTNIREVVELVPWFGAKMDDGLNENNSLDLPDSFFLNNFADKETFHAILSYQ